MKLLQSLFGSKKFMAMLSGLIILVSLKVFKVNLDPATVAEIIGIIAVYIGAQGIADNGKGAAQASAIAGLAAAPLLESEQKRAIEAVKNV